MAVIGHYRRRRNERCNERCNGRCNWHRGKSTLRKVEMSKCKRAKCQNAKLVLVCHRKVLGGISGTLPMRPRSVYRRRFLPRLKHDHTSPGQWEAVLAPASFAWQQSEMGTVRDGIQSPRASTVNLDSGRMGYGDKSATCRRPLRLNLSSVVCNMYCINSMTNC